MAPRVRNSGGPSRQPALGLIVFPSAAPDLNPQEHGWKAPRRAVRHTHTHRRLPDLAHRFEHHLTSTSFPSVCSWIRMDGIVFVQGLFDSSIRVSRLKSPAASANAPYSAARL